MLLIKIIAVLLAGIAIIKSYLDYRKKLEPRAMFIFWTVIWILAAILIVYPSLIDKFIASTRDQTVTISALTSLALIFMLYIVYRIYTKASRLEFQLNQLIRRMALLEGMKAKKK